MKNLKLLSLLVLCLSNISKAQNTTFKLSDYKNPAYFYQSLNLNFGFRNYSDITKYDNNTNNRTYKDYSIWLNADATYTLETNSPKSQSELHTRLNGGFNFLKERNSFETDKSEHKQHSFSNSETLNISGLKRFYSPKQYYFEINGSLINGYGGNWSNSDYYNSDTLSVSEKNKYMYFQSNTFLSLLIGKGRIEQVQDARMALYLLEDLYRLNRDKRPATDEEVLELAKLITSLKYKRFFDDRLRKIAEIIAIDSFMQQKGIAGIKDAAYFTSLNDNWAFANIQARNSGWRVFAGIEGGYSYSNNKSQTDDIIPTSKTNENKLNKKETQLYFVAGLDYEKPISLKWQQSASIKGSFGITDSKNKTSSTNNADVNTYYGSNPTSYLRAGYGYGFYPNTRTWFTADWRLTAKYEKQFTGTTKDGKENSLDRIHLYTGPTVNAYYYLSEKLRLSFNFSGFIEIENKKLKTNIPVGSDGEQTNSHWNQNLTVALAYSLF